MTQNASEMAEATQIAKQVHGCEKGETHWSCEIARRNDEIARLAWWCDGGAGACVVPKTAKAFATRIGTKCHKESKSGIMQRG